MWTLEHSRRVLACLQAASGNGTSCARSRRSAAASSSSSVQRGLIPYRRRTAMVDVIGSYLEDWTFHQATGMLSVQILRTTWPRPGFDSSHWRSSGMSHHTPPRCW